jgi:hypothetical protein
MLSQRQVSRLDAATRYRDAYQAIPFGVSYEANEPLIAAAGDADAEEEEDHRLIKRRYPASSSLHCSWDCFWVSYFSF